MLVFLDIKNKIKVVHVIVRDNKHMVGIILIKNELLVIKASIETSRDAIFWPPHRVYFKETLICSLE